MSITTQPKAKLFSVPSHGHEAELQVAQILQDQVVGMQERPIGVAGAGQKPFTRPVPVSQMLVQLVDGSERTLWMVGQSGEFLRQKPPCERAWAMQSIH